MLDNHVAKVCQLKILKGLTPTNLSACNDHLKAKACKKDGMRRGGGGGNILDRGMNGVGFYQSYF